MSNVFNFNLNFSTSIQNTQLAEIYEYIYSISLIYY